ncbi:MAG: radical SAM family heme chaperone HemW [Rikenellaceae bacterium]
MSAIYFHIPFCKRICGYCDFFKSVKLQHLPAVLDQMERELITQKEFLAAQPIRTVYFGGGTPSLVDPSRVGRFIDLVKQHYTADNVTEITVEVNPDDITAQYLEALRSQGVNRLSIGVQSFDGEQLRAMNRRHSAEQAQEAVRMAQSVGFDNITIDLIFGMAGFGHSTLQQSIKTALSLNVQHISAYHLTIESGTPFARKVVKGEMREVEQEVSQAEYELVERELVAAGFEHYEVSNYARPGFRSQHNSSYWQGVSYLGVGPAAHSFDGHVRRYAPPSVEEYLSGEPSYQSENLSMVDHYNEAVMTQLRCCEGVDLKKFSKQFPRWLCEYLLLGADRWVEAGQLVVENDRLYIPTKHFLLSDAIIESLFYCQPENHDVKYM